MCVLTNTNQPTFRIMPGKSSVIFATHASESALTPALASRCTLSAYIGVFGSGIEACRPWDPSRKRKARR